MPSEHLEPIVVGDGHHEVDAHLCRTMPLSIGAPMIAATRAHGNSRMAISQNIPDGWVSGWSPFNRVRDSRIGQPSWLKSRAD